VEFTFDLAWNIHSYIAPESRAMAAARQTRDGRYRAIEAMQAHSLTYRRQTGVLQGRLDAVQTSNVTLQLRLTPRREADTQSPEQTRPVSRASRVNAPAMLLDAIYMVHRRAYP
jgi:uncharacterized protein with FMN-binding domain